MKGSRSKLDDIILTNGMSAKEWIDSFGSSYDRSLANDAIRYCIQNGYQLSEIKLKFAMAHLRSSSATQTISSNVIEQPQIIYVEKRSKSRGCQFMIFVVIVLTLLAFFTNPSFEKHQDTVQQKLTSIAQSRMAENGSDDIMVFLFGDFAVNKLVGSFVRSNMEYHDYLLFSTTSTITGEENKTITVGIFGKVFIVSKEGLIDALRESWQTN